MRIGNHIFGNAALFVFTGVIVIDVGDILEHVDNALEGAFAADRKHKAIGVFRQILANLFKDAVEVSVFTIHLIDEEDGRGLEFISEFPGFFCLNFNTVNCTDEHDGRTGNTQRTAQITDEIRVTGDIEHENFLAFVVEIQKRGADRNMALLFLCRIVGNRIAVFDSSSAADNARVKEQSFGKCGFTGAAVGNESDASDILCFDSHNVLPTSSKFWHVPNFYV